MNDIVLETRDLCKAYRHTAVLDHVNIQIQRGQIVGFIGQNGAGKTTLLRMVAGLAFPTSGSLALWGQNDAKALESARKRIGCMIEGPALYGGMTARQNMEIQRLQRGLPDKALIDKTLALVGLADTGRKRVRNFSMGMRQRLGIALALLGTPEFLILDEPINGLDPAGIAGVRTLLKNLNRAYGMTILISSHILEELYQTATDFILIDQGRIVETLSEQTLDARCKRHIAIRTNDPQRALLVLEEQLGSDRLRLLPDGTIHCYDHLDDVETVAQVLASAQVLVTGLEVRGETLEAYFLSRIGGGAHHV